VGYFCNFHKAVQSKLSPKSRNVVQSGHPVLKADRFLWLTSFLFSAGNLDETKYFILPTKTSFCIATLGWKSLRGLLQPQESVVAPSLVSHWYTWIFLPGYESIYLGMKLCTLVWNYIPWYEIMYLGMKVCTLVWNYTPGYEIMCLGVKFCT
jgi:hypothetical protein